MIDISYKSQLYYNLSSIFLKLIQISFWKKWGSCGSFLKQNRPALILYTNLNFIQSIFIVNLNLDPHKIVHSYIQSFLN